MNGKGVRRSGSTAAEPLLREYEKERSRPLKRRDLDRIEALSDEIYAQAGSGLAESRAECLEQIGAQTRICAVRGRQRLLRTAAAAAACIVIVLGCNTWTLRAHGKNLAQTVCEFLTGGIQFLPADLNGGSLPEQGEPAQEAIRQMREQCAAYGFSPPLPDYLPEGMTLCRAAGDETPFADFCFADGEKTVQFTFEQFADEQALSDVMGGFPSDHREIREISENGTAVLISREDGQFTAMFTSGYILCTVFTEQLEACEEDSILHSFFG